jgi:hypothetical protein
MTFFIRRLLKSSGLCYNFIVMVFRSCLLVGAFGFASVASASFELMLVQSALADPGTIIHRVHRVDPVSGVNLGSFVIGPESRGLAASISRGELYTIDINGNLRVFDYSTGLRKRQAYIGLGSISDFVIGPGGDSLLIANGTGSIHRYDLNSTAYATTAVASNPGIVSRLAYNATNNWIYALNTPLGRVDGYSPSGNSWINLQSEGFALGLGLTFGQMTHSPVFPGGAYGTLTLGTSGAMNLQYVSSSGQFSGFGSFAVGETGHSSIDTTAASHNGYYQIGRDSSNPSLIRITEKDVAGYTMNTVTLSGVNGGVRNVATVLAPEPGSMAVLGLGLAALLKRRKQKAV